MPKHITYTVPEWQEEGARLFGSDMAGWQFVCPACGNVAAIRDYTLLKAPQNKIGRACIGLFVPGIKAQGDKATGPCSYVANSDAPVRINDDGESAFAFAFASKSEVSS